jgi:hypothetical protein
MTHPPGRSQGDYRSAKHGACLMSLRGAALCLSAVAVAAAAWGQDNSERAQVEQRVRLTARLIADSPTAQRILASGDRAAIGHFDEGRVHQSLAEERLAQGDLPGARRAVEEALHHVGMARRMVPDARARQAAARQRYEQLYPSVERLLEAWRRRAGTAADPELILADNRIAAARVAQQEGRFEDANQLLGAAEKNILAGMGSLLGTRTLDYTERPANAAEEFQLELVRHGSLDALLPLALSELKPGPEAAALIARYRAASQTLLAQAAQQYESANTALALAHVRDAILQLQRALGAAGVTIPAPSGSTP